MSGSVEKVPYEFLARWSADGSLSGCHVVHRIVVEQDGNIVSDTIGSAEPVTADFPLSDIVESLNAAALVALAKANAEKETALSDLDAANKRAEAAEQEVSRLRTLHQSVPDEVE